MDTLTHALSGALLARATEPRSPRAGQLPRRVRMWVGFWAAAFPDGDVVLSFLDPLTYLSAHRGVTHSIVMLPLWAIGLGVLLAFIVRRRYSWKTFAAVCALSIGAHILGDVITSFGTMVLAPLSNWRAQLSTTFIIDLYFTGIIVAGLAASAYWKRSRAPAAWALAALWMYVGFQAVQQHRAIAVGEAYIGEHKLASAKAHALPQPFSPFNWLVVVEQPERYHLATINLVREAPRTPAADASWFVRVDAAYRPARDARWETVERFGTANAEFVHGAWNAPSLARYRDFAMFPALLRIDRNGSQTCVWFDDLRFKLLDRVGPFRYGACRNGDAPWATYRLGQDEHGADVPQRIPD